MLRFSYMWRPSSIGGLSCSPANFSVPSVVSSCLNGLMMLGLAVHDAFGWKGGGSASAPRSIRSGEELGDRRREQRHGARGGNQAGNDARGLTAAAACGASAAGVDAKWGAVRGFWTTIGAPTVKYHAWGDGYQHSRLLEPDDGFTVWYEADGKAVGVLTCNADDDYELGGRLIEAGEPVPVPMPR